MRADTVDRGLRTRLTSLVAAGLELPPAAVDPRTPFARYGLDSLAAAELTATLAAALGRDLPDTILFDCPDLESLERFLTQSGVDGASSAREWMRADCVLPPEIQPGPRPRAGEVPRSVLLSGATGFLGAYLLRALLAEPGVRVHCLVRPDHGMEGRTRVRHALESYGIWAPAFADRVAVIEGDLSERGLGLGADRFARLAREVDAVYHCAATVDWITPYPGLRDVNVRGTEELLRLACRPRAKPFHFVSSFAVCYSTRGPAVLTEADDPLQGLEGIHLGYAQSKCVAEALVRQAGARGLPVAVYRPSLVSGDTGSGAGPTGDVLSALIKGCIQMGAAPDLDWVVDCCPVDYVAEAIVRLSRADRGPHPVFHLANPQPRHWRECVLWLTLYGYPMRLIPYAAWRARLDADARNPAHALHALRSFFLRPAGDDGLTLPELYEDGRRSRVDQGRTHAALHALELACPALSASLLDRYVDSYVRRGFLPPVSARPRLSRGKPVPRLDVRFFERLLRRESGDETLRVTAVDSVTSGAAHSILTELTAWRSRPGVGLRRYRLGVESEGRTHAVGVMVKVKPRDTEVIEVGHAVARLCDGAIGHAYARFRQRLGLTGCHRRELAIYGLTDERLRAHMPAVYGRLADARRGYVLVLEDLSGLPLLDTSDDPGEWSPVHVEAALRGLAEIHAVWYRREASLRRRPWLGPVITARDMGEMRPLWRALAEHAAGDFAAWAGSGIRAIQRALVDEVDRWWASLEAMPRTLIHHDFNPRNIALRPTAAGFRLCAYDWELATLGVPQHDLAELLCFVLVPDTPRDSALHFVETHRTALERATGEPIDPTAWRRGFRLSLQDLLLNRFAMYALAHRIRRQAFLPRIVRTWRTLYQFSEDSGRWPGPGPGRTRHAEVGVGVLPSK